MKSKKALFIALLCSAMTCVVYAKLPTPQLTDEQKAKAEETKAKAAHTAKKDGELLTKSQDRVADRYTKAQKAKGVTVKPTPIVVGGPANAVAPQPASTAAPSPATGSAARPASTAASPAASKN